MPLLSQKKRAISVLVDFGFILGSRSARHLLADGWIVQSLLVDGLPSELVAGG